MNDVEPTATRSLDGTAILDLVNFPLRHDLMAEMESHLSQARGFALATLNLDHIVKLRRSPEFREAYARQTHVVADGNPVVWLLRIARRRVDLIPGSELIHPLAALAASNGVPVALVGSSEAVLKTAAVRLEAEHPGLRVVLQRSPPQGFDPDGPDARVCLSQVADSGAGLCFLAFGAPKQEVLALRGLELAPACGFVSIGAGLDFIAGYQTRAPLWVRRIAMEWLWRLATNPRRLARRYWDCAMILPGLVLDAWRIR